MWMRDKNALDLCGMDEIRQYHAFDIWDTDQKCRGTWGTGNQIMTDTIEQKKDRVEINAES